MPRPASGCATGKRRYRDRLGALMTLADIEASGNAERAEKRIYHCRICHGWHLTSKPYLPPRIRSWRPAPGQPQSGADGADGDGAAAAQRGDVGQHRR